MNAGGSAARGFERPIMGAAGACRKETRWLSYLLGTESWSSI